jgi:putative oxidoreductase
MDEERELDQMKRERRRDELAWVTGRVTFGVVFLIAAVVKAVTFSGVSALLTDRGFAGSDLLLSLAILFEATAGVLLTIGFKVRRTAMVLVGWVILVTALIHWDLREPLNQAFALSNIAIAGGLLFLATHGAGIASIDRKQQRKAASA